MPHCIIEYSANLEAETDMDGLCRHLRDAGLATGLFELGAVRVRAMRCDHYAIADLDPRNGFIDISVRVGTGRSKAARQAAGKAIFEAAQAYLQPLLAAPHFALSLEIREIDHELSWRDNAMHARLRAPKPETNQ